MKKVLLGALAAVAMVACSKDDVVEMNRVNDQISYGAVVNSATRAANVFCNNNMPGSFTVSAEHDGKLYFENDVITVANDGTCSSTATRYWPNSGEVTFYAQVNGNMSYTAGSVPTFDNFVVETTVANQKDLMYAVQKQGKSNDPVALNFRHALSQVVFAAKNDSEGKLYVEVSGVEVHNVANTSTYTFPAEATVNKVGEHNGGATTIDYTDGTWGSWATATGSDDYAVSFAAQEVTATAAPLTYVTDESDFANAMLLMPQGATTAWDPTTHAAVPETTGTYLLINCCIYNVAGASFDPAKDVALWGTQAAHKKLAVPASFTWEQGKKYIYTLVFGKGNGGYDPEPDDNEPEAVLVPISYTITVDDFVVVNAGEIEVE